MGRGRRARLRVLVAALAAAVAATVATPLVAQETAPAGSGASDAEFPPQAVLEALADPRAEFRAGIAEFVPAGSDAESAIAGVTFPRLLYENLARIDDRELSREELEAYARLRLESAGRAAAAQLRSAVEARDRLLFSANRDEDQVAAQRAAAEERVVEARALVDAIGATSPAGVPADAVRPIVFWDGHEEGRLLAAVDGEGVAGVAEEHDLDLVLFGVAEEVEGYQAIDVWAYHRFLDVVTPVGGTIARPEEVGLDAAAVAAEAAAYLLGRPFAGLELVTGVPDAAIYVDGDLVGYESVVVPFLRAGGHEVRVVAPRYETAERVLELEAGQTLVERVELSPAPARVVRIQSSPAGADVYAESVWVGQTPLDYRFPPGSTIVRLRREGHLESRFVVDSLSPSVVNRALLPDSIDWSQELIAERDDFYQALTWFVVSVPVTLLLRGGYQSVLSAFPPAGSFVLDDDELLRLARLGNIFYWSSIGGFLVNGGLFVNLVISVFDYIQVGEGPHNQ